MNSFIHTLFLASKSVSRRALLKNAGIPFIVILQDADEQACDWTLPLPELVSTIARSKMRCAIIPKGKRKDEYCFVVTADTLVKDNNGTIHGKPVDRSDAVKKLQITRDGVTCCTAVCIEKNRWQGTSWVQVASRELVVTSSYVFNVPDDQIDEYLRRESLALQAAGAHCIESFGINFFQSINGSFSSCLGLPLFELRKVLKELGFFEDGI